MSGGEPRATLNSEQGCTTILLEVLGVGLALIGAGLWLFWYWGLVT